MPTDDKVIDILSVAMAALVEHQLALLSPAKGDELSTLHEIHEANWVYNKLSTLVAKVHDSR